ncbi:MAG: riboflavin synthase [Gammaproteobacteria bacterium]|nr:MAG: riboflavin synthase [Gammaproteobacteria bacterium]
MFTGIIQTIGKIKQITQKNYDKQLTIMAPDLVSKNLQLGESIAVNGVCLTVISFDNNLFSADISKESLNLTSLKNLKVNSEVNLERALTLESHLGGHMVLGHVDGTGKIIKKYLDGQSFRFEFSMPTDLAKYISSRGSICIDGTSLTVNSVSHNSFKVNIVPHTIGNTIIKNYQIGQIVNLEIDIIARYLERLIK